MSHCTVRKSPGTKPGTEISVTLTKPRLLAVFVGVVATGIVAIGYLFNAIAA